MGEQMKAACGHPERQVRRRLGKKSIMKTMSGGPSFHNPSYQLGRDRSVLAGGNRVGRVLGEAGTVLCARARVVEGPLTNIRH